MGSKEEYLQKFREKFLNPNQFSAKQLHPDYENKGTLMADIEKFISEALDTQRKNDIGEFVKIVENRFLHEPETEISYEGYSIGIERWEEVKSELRGKYGT